MKEDYVHLDVRFVDGSHHIPHHPSYVDENGHTVVPHRLYSLENAVKVAKEHWVDKYKVLVDHVDVVHDGKVLCTIKQGKP